MARDAAWVKTAPVAIAEGLTGGRSIVVNISVKASEAHHNKVSNSNGNSGQRRSSPESLYGSHLPSSSESIHMGTLTCSAQTR